MSELHAQFRVHSKKDLLLEDRWKVAMQINKQHILTNFRPATNDSST